MGRVVIRPEVCPVEYIGNAFDPVSLLNPVAHTHTYKAEQNIGELIGGFVEILGTSIYHVDAPVLIIAHDLHDKITETRLIARDGWNSPYYALERRVAPRFIIARENAQMATAHKLAVIQPKQRICRRDEIGVVHDLNPIIFVVHQVSLPDKAGHVIFLQKVVRNEARQLLGLPTLDRTAESEPPVFINKGVQVGQIRAFARGRGQK